MKSYKLIVKSMQYLFQNMSKYVSFFLKNCSNILKDFLLYTKKTFYILFFKKKYLVFISYIIFLGFIGRKLIFLYNKFVKTGLQGCLSNTPLNKNSFYQNSGKPNRALPYDLILTRLG